MLAAQTYATLLESARIAALNTLTDILATSDDPKERRLAATAILRTPDPQPNSEKAESHPSESGSPECRRFAAVPRGNRPRAADVPQERESLNHPAPTPPKLSAVEELLALSRAAYGDLPKSNPNDSAEPTAPFIPAATTQAAKIRAAAGAPS